MLKVLGVLALALGLSVGGSVVAQDDGKVAYPKDYRTWNHVKSMVIQEGHPLSNAFGGIHHVYANARALRGLKSGTYEDGAVLVFDLLTSETGGHAIQEGKRKFIGVMQRDSKTYAATGGWGYEAFEGDSRTKRVVADGGASCHACHAQQEKASYVFSQWRR